MGFYINPPDMTKEAFLALHGKPIGLKQAYGLLNGNEYLPVCLIDNGTFTAAGIAYSEGGLDQFMYPDGRPRVLFAVPRKLLVPYYPDAMKGEQP